MGEPRRRGRFLGTVLLVILAAAAVRGGWVIAIRTVPNRAHQLHADETPSLLSRFRRARYKTVQAKFAFYELATRFKGARLVAPAHFASRHQSDLTRVARIEVVVDSSAATRRLGDAALAGEADFVGRIGDRQVLFWRRPGVQEYVVIDPGPSRPLHWLPAEMTVIEK